MVKGLTVDKGEWDGTEVTVIPLSDTRKRET
jgi:hypothetical protein